MKLEKIVQSIKNNIPIVIPAAIVIGGIGLYAGINAHIRRNLEPNAIYCGSKNNIIGFPDWSVNLPKIKNKDIDGNGKYESILLYKNSEGKKLYQEIQKKENGELVFSQPRFYE